MPAMSLVGCTHGHKDMPTGRKKNVATLLAVCAVRGHGPLLQFAPTNKASPTSYGVGYLLRVT